MVSCLQAVQYGPLYFRALEQFKSEKLITHKGNFEAKISIPFGLHGDLNWWIANNTSAFGVINMDSPDLTTGGRWIKQESVPTY